MNDLRVVHKRTPSHFVTAPLSKGANVGAASSCPQGKGICAINRGENGITLIALIVTTILSYDENVKSSNNKGFLLQTI